MATLKTPGVYLREISKFPPSVAQVSTAIPAFVGYTEKGDKNTPTKIGSLLEFEEVFGGAPKPKSITVNLTEDDTVHSVEIEGKFIFYDAIRMFYANGGGDCYIVSVGKNSNGDIKKEDLKKGLKQLEKEDIPTLLVIPEIVKLKQSDANDIRDKMLTQCSRLKDRFAILDVKGGDDVGTGDIDNDINNFRNHIGNDNLKYGAAYYPWLKTTFHHNIGFTELLDDKLTTYKTDGNVKETKNIFKAIGSGTSGSGKGGKNKNNTDPIDDKTKEKIKSSALYIEICNAIEAVPINLPPSTAMAGIYATVDRKRGVWKAPANVSVRSVIGPVVKINDHDQEDMNIDSNSGKSVNAIRNFTGKGTLVWGARTLDGNSNEWSYISVRRFFNMVEESVKKASAQFVFEPNDANTWVKVRAMIENFLTLQWRAGALAGGKPEEAFYVKVGLGETMNAQDVLNGKMMVEIGMAVVRPAEFIVLKFSHKMQEA